jgi:outer membrane lipoprotein-sorting protein
MIGYSQAFRHEQRRFQMKVSGFACLALLTALVTGCGGDSSAPTPTTYHFVAPQVNSQRNYTQTIVDNSNNTINESITETVTVVNSDGSYVFHSEDPTHDSVVVNGTTYSIPTENTDVNNSGQDTSYSFVAANGSQVTCAYNPHANGPDYPLTVGATWTLQYTLTCGSASPIAYTQSGTIEDVESVTVPAGTYSALKLQSTVSWTNQNGTIITQTVTNWRDVATQLAVKRTIATAYGGTLPTTGYAVSTELELQSEK